MTLCELPSGTMTRRKAAAGTPQPAKRTKVAEADTDGTTGSADSRAAAQDTPLDTPGDDAMGEPKVELPSSPVSPSPAPRSSRSRRAAAGRASAATAVIIAEDDAAASIPSRDTIHERLFAPITGAELKAWQGWSDIESEPVRGQSERNSGD